MRPFVSVIIAAGGSALRMGGVDKQYLQLCGKEVLAHSISVYDDCDFVSEIIVVIKDGTQERFSELLSKYKFKHKIKAVIGGKTRAESVKLGALQIDKVSKYIMIADGARPLVSKVEIEAVLNNAKLFKASAVGTFVKDTIKLVNDDGFIMKTPKRENLFAVATPQVFKTDLYLNALKRVTLGKEITDDCMIVEKFGCKVKITRGSYENIKITTYEDLIIAEAILKGRSDNV